MDPVSALGVAAAAVQFLDATVKVYSAYQEIRNNAESSTERNKQLENNIQSAEDLKASLPSTSAPHAATDPISKLTATSTSKAEKLLKLLKYVRGSGEKISSTRATLRALRKKNDIEKLYNSIREDRKTLDHIINLKLLPAIDILTVQQTKEFTEINSAAQELIKLQIEQQKTQKQHHTAVLDTIHGVEHSLELYIDETTRSNTRKKFLGSLHFSEIDQRRHEIHDPKPNTLDWLFDSNSYTSSNLDTKWSDFKQWLCEEDTSTYWISGKAGSGKSTLMAHIVDDERTRRHLETWSGRHKLVVLSFFFWRAGSQLQNSILGLLRSLLYQLCSIQPVIADAVIARLSSHVEKMPTWTERILLDYVTEAIQSSQMIRLCVFIDGLDEYTGRYDDLLDSIERLGISTNAKFCVSSRPELELINRLTGLKQLRLQDFNRNDIKTFVGQSLLKTKLREKERAKFAKAVASQAQGVFLWASLVTQSLVKGAKAGDDEHIMWKRFNSLPQELEKLFQKMLSNVDPVYRESLAFYVQLMNFITKFDVEDFANVSVITTAQLKQRINSYEEFADECKRTETQIATQSAGLLEIKSDKYLEHPEPDWNEAMIQHVSNQPSFTLGPESLDRRRCPEREQYPAMLDYESRRVGWIHRSAFDFFSNQSKENTLLELSSSNEALLQRVGESWIRYIVAAPSWSDEYNSKMRARLQWLGSAVCRFYDQYPKTVSFLLDKLHCIYNQCDIDELHSSLSYRHWFDPATETYTGEIEFWSDCFTFRGNSHYSYMMSQVDRISVDTASDTLSAHLLAVSVTLSFHRYAWQVTDHVVQFIAGLTETLLHRIVQRSEISGAADITKYKCISSVDTSRREQWGPFFWGCCFICACWKEPVTGGSTEVIQCIIYIISLVFFRGIKMSSTKPLPVSLSTLIEITDLYVAPNLVLNRIYIQISAKALLLANYRQMAHKESSNISSFISPKWAGRAARILCVPSLKRHPNTISWSERQYGQGSARHVKWEPVTELQSSQLISLQPRPETSEKLLGLIDCGFFQDRETGSSITFTMVQNAQRLREEVCDMLLQEIKSAEQGLDGGQQLIAAACVRAGLLDPTFDDTETSDGGSSGYGPAVVEPGSC
ncbi:hypothetical protein HD806DRAFT_508078 [Xylariaceae sp. AK1471]|nr:hypothetical protein HD806DRAFT_508078 [Xylariaceae sp. AK1471]